MKLDLLIDEKRQEVFLNGEEKKLPRKEFQILVIIKRSGSTISKRSIADIVGEPGRTMNELAVAQHVCRLRKRLGRKNDIIQTVACVGYKIARGL